ncbi:protein FAR1-related sequence 11 [Tanacetum coccineum]
MNTIISSYRRRVLYVIMLDLYLSKPPNEEDDDNVIDKLLDVTLDNEPFMCHRAGKKPLKVTDPSKDQRNRESQKCECNAHIRVTWKQGFDIFPAEWHVTTFIKDHNHDFLSPKEMPFLPINRIITPEDEYQILLYKEAGLNVRLIIRVMELQKQVKHGELSFFDKDIRNLLAKKIRLVEASDAMSLIDHMKYSKQNNAKFQYVYTVDKERRLENLFWCHPQSFEWYSKYGDVVVFDTTYKVNRYVSHPQTRPSRKHVSGGVTS